MIEKIHIEIKNKQLLLLAHLGKMDKRIRPFEDIAPLNVRKMFILFTKRLKTEFNPGWSEFIGLWSVQLSLPRLNRPQGLLWSVYIRNPVISLKIYHTVIDLGPPDIIWVHVIKAFLILSNVKLDSLMSISGGCRIDRSENAVEKVILNMAKV